MSQCQWSNTKAITLPTKYLHSTWSVSRNNNTNHWNCSYCNTFNRSQRNQNPCNNCGIIDSNRNRTKANAFYQFGITSAPKIKLLPNDHPFFIYRLAKPSIEYYKRRENNGITIRFIVRLTDTKQTRNYNICQMRFVVKNTTNNKYKGLNITIPKPTNPGTFDTFLEKPYCGNYKLDIQAIILYDMATKNGHKQYKKYSPTTELIMKLQRKVCYHESLLQKFMISKSEFESKESKINDDEKYHEPKLIELNSDNDDFHLVYFQFLESAQMKAIDIQNIYIYKIYNKLRIDGYQNKKITILKSLKNEKSKLNEFPLYHGTDLDTSIKILHQGFLRQFSSRSVYGKGTYFARDASYSCSPTYAKPDNDGFQHVLLCNVICGEWCHGKSSMIIPPSKPNRQYLPFETTVNCESTPTVFVTYQDEQAIPTYLISFKPK